MNTDAALQGLAEKHGVLPVFRNLAGREVRTLRETSLALLAACDENLDSDAAIREAWKREQASRQNRRLPREILVETGKPVRIAAPDSARWRLALEDQTPAELNGHCSHSGIALEPLPCGLHTLAVRMGKHTETVRVIVSPPRVPTLPRGTRRWGVNLNLYGLHSDRNAGPGDFRDLARLATMLARHGADFTGILPLHALGWASPEVFSPYSPSDRGFLNARHLEPEAIQPASPATRRQIAAWRARHAASQGKWIDLPAHARALHAILRALFSDFQSRATRSQQASFARFRSEAGVSLERFARFESLSERHGPDMRRWPESTRDPDAACARNADSESFHAWLQWQAEQQLARTQHTAQSAGMALGLYLDLAVGARRDGAEAWAEHASIAHGVSLGAPPDHLSPAGQNWNLAAHAPSRLADNDYRAFRRVLRQNLARCGVIRIDHVLGLMRSFWIPDNGAPGGYIRQPFASLLALLRIEAQRAGTLIVGEDLGLVPDGLRTALRTSGIHSYSVLQFERNRRGGFRSPKRLRHATLACFGTHDTPTLAGYAHGRDIDQWLRLGWIDPDAARTARTQRRSDCTKLMTLDGAKPPARMPCDAKILNDRVHTALARSPAALVSVSLDDLLGEEEAQNLPGTIDEYPNWRRRYRLPLDTLTRSPRFRRLARLMTRLRPRG